MTRGISGSPTLRAALPGDAAAGLSGGNVLV